MGRTLRTIIATLPLLLATAPAVADDTGVALALHDARREGGRLCLSGHFHDGNSAGMASRKAAELEAVKAWAEFTAWEYGTDWARWAKAASKKIDCAESGTGNWGCRAEARPCRDPVSGQRAAGRK